MRDSHTCRELLKPSMPTRLPRRSVTLRMLSLAISSRHPECNPVSTLIGTPASIDAICFGGKLTEKSVSPRAIHSDWSTLLVAFYVANVGEAICAHQFSGDVQRLPSSRNRPTAADGPWSFLGVPLGQWPAVYMSARPHRAPTGWLEKSGGSE